MGERRGERAVQTAKALLRVLRKMQPQNLLIALVKSLEIASRQSHLQLAERISGARDRNVAHWFAGQDYKKALRRTTLIHLSEVMKIAWAEV